MNLLIISAENEFHNTCISKISKIYFMQFNTFGKLKNLIRGLNSLLRTSCVKVLWKDSILEHFKFICLLNVLCNSYNLLLKNLTLQPANPLRKNLYFYFMSDIWPLSQGPPIYFISLYGIFKFHDGVPKIMPVPKLMDIRDIS